MLTLPHLTPAASIFRSCSHVGLSGPIIAFATTHEPLDSHSTQPNGLNRSVLYCSLNCFASQDALGELGGERIRSFVKAGRHLCFLNMNLMPVCL